MEKQRLSYIFMMEKFHDVNVMEYLPPEAGAFYIMGRVYLDFVRFYRMHLCGFFLFLEQNNNTKL